MDLGNVVRCAMMGLGFRVCDLTFCDHSKLRPQSVTLHHASSNASTAENLRLGLGFKA